MPSTVDQPPIVKLMFEGSQQKAIGVPKMHFLFM
jgi:hypothetical protein